MYQGVTDVHADIQSDVLIEAELRDLPSHGLQRLPRLIERLETGLANPTASGTGQWSRPSVMLVDGNRGLGPVVMMETLEKLAVAVDEQGIVVGAIRNANHIGMLAYYAEAAALRGLMAIVMTTSEALVHPFGGTEAMLGTNPIAIGIPTGAAPFILDLATSKVSMGKIHHHALTGDPIPDDWAVDTAGNRTTDPVAAKTGAIAPFGEAKGFGLGLGVELLVAALSGSAFAPEVRGTLDAQEVANKGDVFVLIDPKAGQGTAKHLAGYLDRLRASRPADADRPVLVPGDGMRSRRARALSTGIEIPEKLYQEICALRGRDDMQQETT
ncbi:dehydrogenase [Sulfitobacter alexandrii]|uniref:Dehydrogenase n=2 Tax=Sulfitobacter alexandrii TaxID=1917485 RepID=A0A1J0WM63_9RHOB|nr:dehydrogenase [Sulfitobacter alexandrii]